METLSAARRIAILQDCHAIELASFELYTFFSHIFTDDQGASGLWRKAALEEERHAAQFITAASIPGEMIARVRTTPLRIAEARDEVTALVEKVKADPPTLEEALEMAVRLERQLADLHMDCVMEFCHEPFNQLFREMMEADLGHVTELEQAYRNVYRHIPPIRPDMRDFDDSVRLP